MKSIRQPAVAGLFYPEETSELEAMLTSMLVEARAGLEKNSRDEDSIRGLIAPHAGYIYSGPIAASAYAQLSEAHLAESHFSETRDSETRESEIRGTHRRRVVLLGPSHRVGFQGLALPGVDGFATPLGVVELDAELRDRLRESPLVVSLPEAHAAEHSLEVQIPFLQHVLGEFTLLPLVVGRASPADVAAVLDLVMDEPDVLVVISSDLSHFLDYDDAMRKDQETSRAILDRAPERIGPHEACGCRPLGGLLLAARERGLQARMVDLRNSGDTAGDRERVVGYGAYVVQ